jgi:hypothetical protein
VLEVNDTSMRDFLHRFLGSEQSGITIEEAHSALVRVDGFPQPANQQLIVAAQVLFRYRLLDVFSDVLDCPHHPEFREVPRTPRPPGSVVRLDRVGFISVIF